MPLIARVEPLTTTRALRGPFDYRLPEALASVEVGTLLSVPFAGRQLLGVVVERATASEVPDDRLAEPHARVEPSIPAELVAVARWIGEEYCSTFSRALGLMLPPGAGRDVRPRVRVREVLVAEATEAGRAAVVDGAAERLTDRQRAVLERLAADGPLPATQTGADHGGLRRLADRGLLVLEPRALRRRPFVQAVGARALHAPPLTDEQRAALAPILAAVTTGVADRFLLHGVTGSGKTEVYLQAAEAALGAGGAVLVLVPEIALAPQTVARFQARFGDTVAVLHSQLGQGERYDEWLRLQRGEARIAVGPRSAVFAPLDGLRLVIVDEEHEPARCSWPAARRRGRRASRRSGACA